MWPGAEIVWYSRKGPELSYEREIKLLDFILRDPNVNFCLASSFASNVMRGKVLIDTQGTVGEPQSSIEKSKGYPHSFAFVGRF